jgi:hypothetical protein
MTTARDTTADRSSTFSQTLAQTCGENRKNMPFHALVLVPATRSLDFPAGPRHAAAWQAPWAPEVDVRRRQAVADEPPVERPQEGEHRRPRRPARGADGAREHRVRSGASGSGLDRRSPVPLEAHGHHLVNRGCRRTTRPSSLRSRPRSLATAGSVELLKSASTAGRRGALAWRSMLSRVSRHVHAGPCAQGAAHEITRSMSR